MTFSFRRPGTLAAALCLTALLSAPLRAQDAACFQPLWSGGLTGWTAENTTAGNFTAHDGVLRVAAPGGWLRSARQFTDFSLRAEFRFLSDDADSGFFLRAPASGTFGNGWPNRSYQVQLRNPLGQSRYLPVGGLYRHGMPAGETQSDPAAPLRVSTGTGSWQTLEIDLVGESLTARLNGEVLTRATGVVSSAGHIGLQGETGALEFRSIVVCER